MHICFASLDYPSATGGGGVGTQVKVIGAKLVRRGHKVSVVALQQNGLPDYVNDSGVEVYRVKPGDLHWYVSRLPILRAILPLSIREMEYGWAIWKQIRAIHRHTPIDVIEATETSSIFLAFQKEIPLIIRLHGEQYTFHKYTPALQITPNISLGRRVQRMAMRQATMLTSPSKAHAREIESELRLAEGRIRVVANALPLHKVNFAESERSEDALIILFVGRIEHPKGVPLLIKSFEQVAARFSAAELVLLGANHPTLPRDEIDHIIKQANIAASVRMLGHVERECVEKWYNKATLVVLPSYYETFGLAAIEPMAHGLPVVCSNRGALPELISDGETGILVDVDNSDMLSSTIIDLIADPARRVRIGQNGRLRVQEFSAPKLIDEMEKIYDSARIRAEDGAALS